MKTKIMVTGCAGFIGSHLCERLLADGYKVIGIDNFDPFYPRHMKEFNMSGFKLNPDFVFFEADIVHFESLLPAFKMRPDVVVHIAAKAGVRPSIKNPEAYILTNINGTNNILQGMQQFDLSKLFFASSSSIYGNQKEVPFREDRVQDEPISPYAFTKRACELMNFTYHHLYQMDIINARFFTVYGPRQRPDLAIHKFTHLIDQGHSIPVYGDGSTGRDYTFVSDTVDGITRGVNHLLSNNELFETVNLGNQSPVQLLDLIHLIYKHLGREPNLEYMGMQPGDVEFTYADIDKAKNLFGYQPQTSMDDGIRQFVDWYKVNKKVYWG